MKKIVLMFMIGFLITNIMISFRRRKNVKSN